MAYASKPGVDSVLTLYSTNVAGAMSALGEAAPEVVDRGCGKNGKDSARRLESIIF